MIKNGNTYETGSYFDFESDMRSLVYNALRGVAKEMFIKRGWEDYLPEPELQQEALAEACDFALDQLFDDEVGGYDE